MKRVLVAAAALMMAGLAWAQQTVFDAPTLTITAGGTSQQVFPYNESRRFLLIENPVAATETLFCNFAGAATLAPPSFSLMAGGSYYAVIPNFVPKDAVNCNATTTAHAFTAKEG